MRIIVTGGAGFIGQHLCRRLLAEGHSVVCFDNFLTGSRAVADELRAAGAEIFECDVVSWDASDWDQVYNLACPASPIHYMQYPLQTIFACVVGTTRVLQSWCPGRRVLHASTSEVYGEPAVHPQPETYFGNVNSYGPRACYDEGKRCAEAVCYTHATMYGVDVRVARIFNTYGPGMATEDGRIVPEVIKAALDGTPFRLHGGEQTRSFCYVDDTVDGLIRLMNSEYDFTRPVNIGNPHETPLRTLMAEVERVTGRKLHVINLPYRQDDPMRRCPDIGVAKRELGWSPVVELGEGIARTVEWFRHAQAKDHSAA